MVSWKGGTGRDEHGTQSPRLCANSESPEAIIKALLTTGLKGSLSVSFLFF